MVGTVLLMYIDNFSNYLSLSMNIKWLETNKDSLVAIDEETRHLINLYNWPADGYVGHGVKFIYHLMLHQKCKILTVDKEGDDYHIHIDRTSTGQEVTWLPKEITLTPRPSG